MSNYEGVVNNYFEMWNQPDPAERFRIIRQLWTADAVSVDPLTQVSGHEQIAAMVARFHENYAGHTFALSGEVQQHNDRAYFQWEMKNAAQSVQLVGFDCVRLQDGKIADLAGFWNA